MRAIATLAAAAALLALTACERLGIGGGDAAGAPASVSANAATNVLADSGKDPAVAPAAAETGGKDIAAGATPALAGGGLDRNYIAGRWTDTDDCGAAVEFILDGRFIGNDGSEALWNLVGDRLIVTGARTLTMQIVRIDQNEMAVVNPDGTLGGRSTRC